MISGNLSIKYGLRGPNLAIVTACTTGLHWVKSEYLAWLKASGSRESLTARARTMGELRVLAMGWEELRLKHEREQSARDEAERGKQRENYLMALATDFDRHWRAIDQHAECGTASCYDKAKRAIADLADAYELASDREVFDSALQCFMKRHSKRTALIRRLIDAGLWEK